MMAVSLLLLLAALLHSTLSSVVFEDEHHATVTSTARPKFSRSELECFKQGKVLYEPDGKCYKLLEAGPCRVRGQWLVLDQDEVISGNGRLRPVCRQCPCCGENYRAVYWPADGQCHKLIENKELCPSSGTIVQTDPFGEGECACKKEPPHGQWNIKYLGENPPCYPLYQRGPCENEQIFVPSKNSTICQRDPCIEYNRRNSTDIFVQWEDGNGRCYILGSKGPCEGKSIFKIHPVTKRPACMLIENQIVDLPPNCDTDQNGNCREEVELPSDSEYISDLLNSVQRKRTKRRTKTNKQ